MPNPFFLVQQDAATKAVDIQPVDLAKILGGGSAADKLTVRSAWTYQAWLRRCVDLRAQAFAGVPWQLRRGETVVWDSEDETRPDDLDTLHNLPLLMYLAEAAQALEGRTYALITRRRGQFHGLQWWDPTSVTEAYDDRTGRLVGFERRHRVGEPYRVDDVFHLYAPDPYTEIGPALGDGAAARVHADVLHSVATFADNYLDRGLIKAGMILTPPGTQKEERDRIESWFERVWRGVKNAGNWKVFNSQGAEFVAIGEGLKDLSDKQLNEDQRVAVAAGLGVPYSLVAPDGDAYASKTADQRDLYLFKVLPSTRRFQAAVNRQVLEPLGLRIVFQPGRLDVFQELELAKAEKLMLLTGGKAIITQDEAREMLGKDPMPQEEEEPEAVPVEEEDMTGRAVEEVKAWRRKASTKGAGAPFETRHIPARVARVIRQRLADGEDLDAAFRPPWGPF